MERISAFADSIISRNKFAFVIGRYKLDPAVMLHEVMHELSSKKLKGILLKIDYEKAYDIINWNFVEEVPSRKGFDPWLQSWIMKT